MMGDSAIASFDPYTILSIDRGATDKQIKKAYKLKVKRDTGHAAEPTPRAYPGAFNGKEEGQGSTTAHDPRETSTE